MRSRPPATFRMHLQHGVERRNQVTHRTFVSECTLAAVLILAGIPSGTPHGSEARASDSVPIGIAIADSGNAKVSVQSGIPKVSARAERTLHRPNRDKFSVTNPVYRPGIDKFEVRDLLYRPKLDKFAIHDLSFRCERAVATAPVHEMKQIGAVTTSNNSDNAPSK